MTNITNAGGFSMRALLISLSILGSVAYADVNLQGVCGHLGQVEPGRGAPEDARPNYYLQVICNGNEAAEANHVLVFDDEILSQQTDKSWPHQKGWLTRYKMAAREGHGEGIKNVSVNRLNLPFVCVTGRAESDPCAADKTVSKLTEVTQVTHDPKRLKAAK
jgi:hypothetical protein